MKRIIAVFAVVLLLGGCMSLSGKAQANHVTYVTASEMARGTLVNARTASFPAVQTADQIGIWYANKLAARGDHDEIILIEFVAANTPPGSTLWKISLYR
jgi:hypothetical protein